MPSSLVVPLCRKSILVAVQSKIINLNANKGKGGAGARGHSNIHTYCYIETSSSLPQPSHLHLLFWTEDIIQGFYSIRTLGRCGATPAGIIRCTNTSASDIIHMAQSSGPMTNEHSPYPLRPHVPPAKISSFFTSRVLDGTWK